MTTRRTFLKSTVSAATGAAALTTLPSMLSAQGGFNNRRFDPKERASFLDDPQIKALAHRGLDAARGAGAQFADVRLTDTYILEIRALRNEIGRTQNITVGVRALVDGFWGFAAGNVWTADELVRLGREAVAQAKVNVLGKVRPITMASVPHVEHKTWVMPAKIDAFEINPVEIIDFLNSLSVYVTRTPNAEAGEGGKATFVKQDKVYASTEGNVWTQRTYRTGVGLEQHLVIDGVRHSGAIGVTPTGAGWEAFYDLPVRRMVDEEFERIRADAALPVIPVDVGKYPAVFDAASVSSLLSNTIGEAIQLDRAMGYEANADGTSYLTDPSEMIGTFAVGSPLLSVSGNRTMPSGVATVQWDDESVASHDFPIVSEGRITDFATSRESAGWLKDAYARTGSALVSHGCAYAPTGVDAPMIHTPNLVMKPGTNTETLETLMAGMGKGMLFKGFGAYMDFQQLNGLGQGGCYEIRNGKRVARVGSAGVLFRTPELWKSLVAIGGTTSAERVGLSTRKGEPPQTSYHSVSAVPAAVKEVTLIDIMRKA